MSGLGPVGTYRSAILFRATVPVTLTDVKTGPLDWLVVDTYIYRKLFDSGSRKTVIIHVCIFIFVSNVPVFIKLMSVVSVYACGVEKVGTEPHGGGGGGVISIIHTHTHTHTHT